MAKPTKWTELLVFVVAASAIFIGAFVYSHRSGDDDEPAVLPELTVDLNALNANNPHINAEKMAKGRSAYLVTEKSSGRAVRLPTREAPGAKIRFVDCDLKQIPRHLLYAVRKTLVCVEVRNDKHLLAAYYFENDDKITDMVNFFEQNVEPDRRVRAGYRGQYEEEQVRRTYPGNVFMFSYRIENGAGFVGYDEIKNSAKQ